MTFTLDEQINEAKRELVERQLGYDADAWKKIEEDGKDGKDKREMRINISLQVKHIALQQDIIQSLILFSTLKDCVHEMVGERRSSPTESGELG